MLPRRKVPFFEDGIAVGERRPGLEERERREVARRCGPVARAEKKV